MPATAREPSGTRVLVLCGQPEQNQGARSAPPAFISASAAAPKAASYAEVRAVIDQRCAMCHNAQLQQKNVALHTPELLKQHAQAVNQQVAILKLMPLNNATQITDEERALIKRWFDAGAPTQ